MATYRGTEIAAGTDAEVAAQVAAIDSAKYQAPGAPAKIGVAALSQPAQTPAKVTLPAPATGTESLGGLMDANAAATTDAFQANLDAKAKAAESASSSSLQDYLKSSLGGKTQSELTNDAYAGTVDPAQAELQDINQQITAESLAARRAEERLRKNPQGLYGGALEQAVQDIRDKSIERQADLSVIQLAKQGKYDSAKAIADRYVQAKFERRQLTNDALKFTYEQNKDLFDKTEQRAFETAQSKREADMNFERQKEMARFEQTIKQNDPLYQANLAKARADAATAAGATGGVLQLAQTQSNINNITGLTTDAALSSSVGPNPLVRFNLLNPITGAKSNFIAGVEQLRSQLSLDSLINAKANGATFGALSEGELKLLQDSGSKLSSWAIKKDGNVVGYKVNEKDFKAELDKINNFSKLDYLLKGGNPQDVGVVQQRDGSYWTQNSDGTVTKLN